MELSGIKHDHDKEQWWLLPLEVLKPLVRVLMHGAKKYAPFNWQKVVSENPNRHFDACIRHLTAWQGGELYDKESGLPHLSHALCCLLFLQWNELNEKKLNKL